jgi:hypothetical protein
MNLMKKDKQNVEKEIQEKEEIEGKDSTMMAEEINLKVETINQEQSLKENRGMNRIRNRRRKDQNQHIKSICKVIGDSERRSLLQLRL